MRQNEICVHCGREVLPEPANVIGAIVSWHGECQEMVEDVPERAIVVIESPFQNLADADGYLDKCIAHSLKYAESPYASHRMLVGPLDDGCPTCRRIGIQAGYAFYGVASLVAFYVDHGWSAGMLLARSRCEKVGADTVVRRIL